VGSPPPPPDPPAGAGQQAQQAALAALLTRAVAEAFGILDVHALVATVPQLGAAVAALVRFYGAASGAVAARFYAAARADAGIIGHIHVPVASPAGLAEVTRQVEWATQGLWSPPAGTPGAPTGDAALAAARDAFDAALVKTQGVAENLMLTTARSTVIGAVGAHRAARGWARVTEPGACSFCLLLATRGPVYRSEGTADFQAHDHCRCVAEPVFGAYEPTAQVRAAQQIYRESTGGLSGGKARDAFRRAVQDDPRLNPGAPAAPAPVPVSAASH
jgi:hypothetical protein